ncbi:type II toxin-antitoxin system RelE/ParE family toxin [Mucilaginibacter terrae]|uniref:type II toxin-antitoxin system RelE/ParE family toxin n=1 Tax=Mucilaginibacter terrae TaxID=1955052 RepID=UPI0035DE8503
MFLPKALQELADAWECYEDRQAGLGDRFELHVLKKVNTILRNPEHYERKKNQYREARVDTFPYLIIYKIDKEKYQVLVISVFHTSRSIARKV